METQDERIARITRGRFHKSGRSSDSTGLLDELSADALALARSVVALEEGELLIVASMTNSQSWSALTTRRLLVSAGSELCSVLWEHIDQIDVDFLSMPYSTDIKSRLSQATVTTFDSKELVIGTCPGDPFMGFWNCILWAKRMAPEEARRRACLDRK